LPLARDQDRLQVAHGMLLPMIARRIQQCILWKKRVQQATTVPHPTSETPRRRAHPFHGARSDSKTDRAVMQCPSELAWFRRTRFHPRWDEWLIRGGTGEPAVFGRSGSLPDAVAGKERHR